MRRLLLLVLIAVLPLQLVQAQDKAGHPEDPWESFNRGVFAFNETIDRYFLKPVAKGYRWVTPGWMDDSVTRVFQNAKDVPSAINHVLQWQWRRAGHSSARVLMNTTMGIGGLLDVASKAGLEKHSTDFGLTMASWGVASGPYLVLPGLGPSTLRDAAAIWPDNYLAPRSLIEHDLTRWSVTALYIVDLRADLLNVEKAMVGDRYGFMREFYLSSRKMAAGIVEEDDFGADFESGDWGDDGWGDDAWGDETSGDEAPTADTDGW
ncbi:VacJ family lipoprotein [Alcanivorax sp. 1008]|uniref:MlaA family lipoprotein n=1 Tax=Alcanivorax sp. 1008 TaxID=2816853 RepID=UPI001DA37A1F|nr:VacJ family lipoprotein [Alcanivorax sp. 1008]MCC1497967.1 VacJ family lipoprotein [Alcanivorax sp. 1008]